jgi:amino acid transporter
VTGAAQGVDASRVVYAFSRDNALPGSRFWRQINPITQTPVYAVWFVMVKNIDFGTRTRKTIIIFLGFGWCMWSFGLLPGCVELVSRVCFANFLVLISTSF